MIYPHNSHSKSAKALAKALQVKLIRREGSKFKPSERKTIINWGCREIPAPYLICNVLNAPQAVDMATNKLTCLQELQGHARIPLWTTTAEKAREWEGDRTIIVRTQLHGHGGAGIVVASPQDELPNAALYTRYIPKEAEYRVHVMFGKVVDVQKKARRHDVPDDQVNWTVRNYNNGFIYKREDIAYDPDVVEQSLIAVKTLNLEFGAVDVIWNEHSSKAYVLEINTAPGLEGTTLETYRNVLKEYL